jgi:hypothetical protein
MEVLTLLYFFGMVVVSLYHFIELDSTSGDSAAAGIFWPILLVKWVKRKFTAIWEK